VPKPQPLTVNRIRLLKPTPDGKEVFLRDEKTPGLIVRVTPAGNRRFNFLYWSPVSQRQRRVTLNKWPTDPQAQGDALAEARQRALSLGAEMAAGRDPLEAAQPGSGMTVADLLEHYLEAEARPSLKTSGQVERTLRNHLIPTLGKRPIATVTRKDLHAILDRLVKKGKLGACANVRKYTARLFNFALERDLLPASPAANLRVKALQRRQPDAGRELSDEELRAVWAAIGEERSPWRECMRLLLLTGQRRTEIAELQWTEVDDQQRLLAFDPARYKTGIAHLVPLPAVAWEILSKVPKWEGCPYVFSLDGKGPVRAFGRLKKRLDTAAERHLGHAMPPWRGAHDLRVTVASRLASLGVPAEIGEAVLGHLPPRLRRVYQKHLFLDEKREALEQWAKHLMELVS